MSNFDRKLDQSEVDFLGSLYDEIEVQEFETVEDQIRRLESRYIDRKFLAEGGLKTVEVANDILTGREVALAIPRDGGDGVIREKFFREARLTASLEHPNIIPVYDLGLDAVDQPYFAMKLIKGRTLKELYKKEELGLNEKLNILIKVCDAISYAHSQQIIHLDLKPDNIQISSFGEVTVCDWGLAKSQGGLEKTGDTVEGLDQFEIDNMTLDGVIKGTPGYMAPEQISGDPKNARTDVYALGAILFEMLYDDTPVQGDTVVDLVKMTLRGKLVIPSREVPAPLKAVALKALSLRPEDRYNSAEEFQDDIQNYLSGRATAAENAGLGRLFVLLVRRNKALSLTLVASLVILVTSTLQFIDSIQQREKEARDLLAKYEKENKDKLTLAEDAEPRLTAKINDELERYKLSSAELSISKFLELLPNSEKGRLFKGRLAFLMNDYETALEFMQAPETPIDIVVLKYLKSPRLKSNKTRFVDGLFKIHDHGAMKYLRAFNNSVESRGVQTYINEIAAKWRFVQDSWHLLDVASLANEQQKQEILKRVFSLLSKSSWSGTPDLAHAAARVIEDDDLRERFLKLFTRNIALMRKVSASGSTLNPVYHAVDGRKAKPSNRWEAGPCPVYMTVDLGEIRQFNKILIYFKRSKIITFYYKISYSTDGKNFQELIDASQNKVIEEIKPLTHRFPTIIGRYIRLTALGNSENDRAFVREFEVYEEVKNLAVGQYCTQDGESMVNLTNGTSYTGAYTELKRNAPVVIDLGEVCEMAGAKVSFKRREELPYRLYYSMDGQEYKAADHSAESVKYWRTFEAVKGRYVKVEFPQDKLIYVNEIRILKASQYLDSAE
ncbi:MAG: protein kinase [Lentisphaerales bacterium]|nr:protein kinase [Lentisphaerales bacterium]